MAFSENFYHCRANEEVSTVERPRTMLFPQALRTATNRRPVQALC